MHYGELGDKELGLALKFYFQQLSSLPQPVLEECETQERIIALRKDFIEGLTKIVEEKKSEYSQTKREQVLLTREKALQKAKEIPKYGGHNKTSWLNIDEEAALKAADVLTEAHLKQEGTRTLSVTAPLKTIIEKLTIAGFYHAFRGRPIANTKLLQLNDIEIVSAFSSIIFGLLNYYRPVDNFSGVKGIVEGLRRSCALTLARKHKKNHFWVYQNYGSDIRVEVLGRIYCLPTMSQVAKLSPKFLITEEVGFDLETIINKFRFRDNLGGKFF